MEFQIFPEWNNECGIFFTKIDPLEEGIKEFFKKKNYGSSISQVGAVLTCRPYDFKQRIRFKKLLRSFEYDILLDYFLIKNVEMEEKKKIIRRQMIEITNQAFSKYKFKDFDTETFLSDFEKTVNAIEW